VYVGTKDDDDETGLITSDVPDVNSKIVSTPAVEASEVAAAHDLQERGGKVLQKPKKKIEKLTDTPPAKHKSTPVHSILTTIPSGVIVSGWWGAGFMDLP